MRSAAKGASAIQVRSWLGGRVGRKVRTRRSASLQGTDATAGLLADTTRPRSSCLARTATPAPPTTAASLDQSASACSTSLACPRDPPRTHASYQPAKNDCGVRLTGPVGRAPTLLSPRPPRNRVAVAHPNPGSCPRTLGCSLLPCSPFLSLTRPRHAAPRHGHSSSLRPYGSNEPREEWLWWTVSSSVATWPRTHIQATN
jgi:hypothetical protein